MSLILGTLFVVACLGIFAALAIYLLIGGWRTYEEAAQSQAWSMAPVRKLSVRLDENVGRSSRNYQVMVNYSFKLHGKNYHGSCVTIGYQGSRDKEGEEELERRLNDAIGLQVRYDPEDPSKSCLTCGIPRQALLGFAFATAILCMLMLFGFSLLLGNFSDTVLLESLDVK